MRRFVVGVLSILLLSSCGAEESRVGAPFDKTGPWRVVFTFALDLETAKADGRLPADADVGLVFAQAFHVMEERVRQADLGAHRLAHDGPERILLGFKELAEDERRRLVRLLTRPGTLEFLIEVLPDDQYRERLNPRHGEPARLGLWNGTAEAFQAFKQAEAQAWGRARAEGTTHRSSNPAYRLVLEEGLDGSDPAHFHVLEVPSAPNTFDGRMLADPLVMENERGDPVVVFDIRKSWQKRLEAWTRSNVQLPVAIVLDGTFRMAPLITAPLSKNVQIAMGSGPPEEMERQAKELVLVLQTGALPVTPRLVSIAER